MMPHMFSWLERILSERFGHEFKIVECGNCFRLQLSGAVGAVKIFNCRGAFHQPKDIMPCAKWDAVVEGWCPVLGEPLYAPAVVSLRLPLVENKNGNFCIHYDILNLIYWMLSRLEEVGRNDLDKHGRFPAASSHAYKYGYLERPIVDEWLDILGQVMCRQWPGLVLKQHVPRTLVSCDIDQPYLCYSKSLKATLRVMAGDIIKRKSPVLAMCNLNRYLKMKRGDFSSDPYLGKIYWIMQVNDAADHKVAFYFIPEHLSKIYDGCYDMDEPVIRKLLRDIHHSGHEVGLHASYNTYDDELQTIREAEILRSVMQKEGIEQPEIGSRQHYLRWKTPVTARNLCNSGLVYDSTLGYADHPGFRCGTCFEYPMYDPIRDCELNIRQRPLVLMECSVIDGGYMGRGYTKEALDYIKLMRGRCYQVGGDFTLLWHNSHLENAEDREFYLELLLT